MWPFKSQQKQALPFMQTKSIAAQCGQAILSSGGEAVGAGQALYYYETVGPVADAINRIADEVCSVRPILKNTRTGEIIKDHKLLALLKNPNPIQRYQAFIKSFVVYYLATGNNFLVATGQIDRPPLELTNLTPRSVSVTAESKDGLAYQYTVSGAATYTRTPIDYRFVTLNPEAEMFHSRDLNTGQGLTGGQPLLGASRLRPHVGDIKQNSAVATHNISLLDRSGVPSVIISVDRSSLSDEEFTTLWSQLQTWYAGAQNAGRLMLSTLDQKVDVLNAEKIDMNFGELFKQTKEEIFGLFKIPLPLISADTMTLANFEAANIVFYISTVLPLLKYILEELGSFLLPRYKGSEDLVLTYDKNAMEALEPLRMDRLKKITDMGVITIDEIRSELAFDEVAGGDDIYKPMNEIPVASTSGVKPERPTQPMPALNSSAAKLIDILRQQKTVTGERRFSDAEIIEIAGEEL